MTASSSHIIRLTRSAALGALLIATGFVGIARANDEYGTGHDSLIRQAATAAPSAALSMAQTDALREQFKTGENNGFGETRAPMQPRRVEGVAPRAAAMAAQPGW